MQPLPPQPLPGHNHCLAGQTGQGNSSWFDTPYFTSFPKEKIVICLLFKELSCPLDSSCQHKYT